MKRQFLTLDWSDPAARSRLGRIVVSWVVVALALTAAAALATRFATPTGLNRTVYEGPGFGGDPLLQDTTSQIDVTFVERQPELPRRFFSVRWQGFWFLPRQQTIDLYAGGDDRVDVFIDGELILRRNGDVGMNTTFRTLTLGAGAHELLIEYQQWRGIYHLTVDRAPAGENRNVFPPGRLFHRRVDSTDFWINTIAAWLNPSALVVWVVPPATLLLCIAILGTWYSLRGWWRALAAMTMRDLGERIFAVGAPALLAPAMLFLIGPHTIHATNPGEFALAFSALAIPWLLAVVIMSWIALMGIGCILPKGAAQSYVALLFVVGVLVWAQGNIWVGDYGVLDGSEIDFSRLNSRVPYELGALAVGLAAALGFRRQLYAVAPLASFVFLGLQAAAMSVSSLDPAPERTPRWVEPPAELFQFSSKQNVIHLVLDEFQSDVLREIVDAERSRIDQRFSGFVYFDDHSGAFPTTSLSMPAMLTGEIYGGERPVREFVRAAFEHGSIFSGLREHGYEVDIASTLPRPWLADWIATDDPSAELGGPVFKIPKPFVSVQDYRKFSARLLIELSVFRHAPHVLKTSLSENPDWFGRVFWNEGNESLAAERRYEASNSAAFLEQFIGRMTVARSTPVYKLIHLGVPHRPVVLDRDCAFIGVASFSRDVYLEQSACAVDLVAAFLDRLRSLDIYEESLIVVSSDHGTSLVPRGFSGESGSLPMRRGPSTERLGAIAGTAKAIMMIKAPGADGPLVISGAPTMHGDLPATIFEILGLNHRFPGQAMLHRDPDETRRRTYSMYDVSQRFPEGHLRRLDLLSVDGNLLDASRWNFRRSIMPPGLEYSATEVDLGTTETNRYWGPGWLPPDPEGSDGSEVTFASGHGKQAVLFMSLPNVPGELTARVSSSAESAWDAIEVNLDGRLLGRWSPAGNGYQDYSLPIPGDPSRPTISTMTFRFFVSTPGISGVRFDRISVGPATKIEGDPLPRTSRERGRDT